MKWKWILIFLKKYSAGYGLTNDGNWWHIYGSTLAQAIACRLAAPSHHLMEPILTNYQWAVVAFTSGQFHTKFSQYISLLWVWILPIEVQQFKLHLTSANELRYKPSWWLHVPPHTTASWATEHELIIANLKEVKLWIGKYLTNVPTIFRRQHMATVYTHSKREYQTQTYVIRRITTIPQKLRYWKVSEWVIKCKGLSQTTDSKDHIINIDHVIITYILVPLSSLTQISHHLQVTRKNE